MGAGETTTKLRALLSARYNKNATGVNAEWVQVHEAPLGNDERQRRFCDMIAVGVWKKTKNRVIGHEIKASRADWLKEVDDPEKSEAFTQYCHRWYIVAAPGIVKLEELKPEWGLMEATKNLGGLRIKKQPKDSEPIPIPMPTIAAWMRRVEGGRGDALVHQEVEKRVKQRIESESGWLKKRVDSLNERNESLAQTIRDFEAKSGVRIGAWGGNEKDIEVVRLVRGNTPEKLLSKYQLIQSQIERLLESTNAIADALEKVGVEGGDQDSRLSI